MMRNTVKDISKAASSAVAEVRKEGSRKAGRVAKRAITSAIGSAGAALGLPPSLSQTIGSNIVEKISHIIGKGDYEVNDDVVYNSLFPKTSKVSGLSASFATEHESVRRRAREFVGYVAAGVPSTFSVTSYSLQPASYDTFNVLPQLAMLYEEYMFEGLVLEYAPNVSPYSTVPNMGFVGITGLYNATSTTISNSTEFLNTNDPITCRPDKGAVYGFECADQPTNGLYVRQNLPTSAEVLAGNSIPKTSTDLGTAFVAVENTGAFEQGTTLGRLFVSYDIVFRKPRAPISKFGITDLNCYLNATGAASEVLALSSGTIAASSIYGACVNDVFPSQGTGQNYQTLNGAAPGDIIRVAIVMESLDSDATYSDGGLPEVQGCELLNILPTGGYANLFQVTGSGFTYALTYYVRVNDVFDGPIYVGMGDLGLDTTIDTPYLVQYKWVVDYIGNGITLI